MEACSLVAGFEYVLFFIPEMWRPDLILDLAQNFIQVPQWFGVTHQGQEGEFSGRICWVAIDGLVSEMAKGPKDGLDFSDRLDMSWFEINNWIDGWYIEMVIRRVGWCSIAHVQLLCECVWLGWCSNDIFSPPLVAWFDLSTAICW